MAFLFVVLRSCLRYLLLQITWRAALLAGGSCRLLAETVNYGKLTGMTSDFDMQIKLITLDNHNKIVAAYDDCKQTYALYKNLYENTQSIRKNVFEVEKRLAQLGDIIKRILQQEINLVDLGNIRERVSDERLKEDALSRVAILESMEIDTESFYNTAFIIIKTARTLPKLEKFDSRGVNRVRNKLINHAECKGSGVVNVAFGWGSGSGASLKTSELFPDNGLYKNCIEFFSVFNHLLKNAFYNNSPSPH